MLPSLQTTRKVYSYLIINCRVPMETVSKFAVDPRLIEPFSIRSEDDTVACEAYDDFNGDAYQLHNQVCYYNGW